MPGRLGDALDLDSGGRYVNLGNPTDGHFNIGAQATIEAWIRFDSAPAPGNLCTIMAKDEGPGQDSKFIFAYTASYAGYNDVTMFHINSPATGDIWLVSNPWTPNLGQWYHVAVVKSGYNYTFYLDGVVNGTASTISDSLVNVPIANAPLTIGWSELSYTLNGTIDDVRLWNTALAGSDISQTMATDLTGTEPGLVGYWKMDNMDGATVLDSTTYGSNGQIVGGTFLPSALYYESGTVENITLQGTMTVASGASITVAGSLTLDGGTIVPESGSVNILGSVAVNGARVPTGSNGQTYAISGDLLGNTINAAQYASDTTVQLDGSGTAQSPQQLEAMSDDLGAVPSAIADNFEYGTLAIDGNTYVQLVDDSANAAGSGSEAVYADTLIVSSGATLDLNGLHVYARNLQVSGTIIGGTIAMIPEQGPIALDCPTPGTISTAGESDDWSFYRAGQAMTIVVDPGSSGIDDPKLLWAEVDLIGATGTVLASTSSTVSGQPIMLSSETMPVDGTYQVQVKASNGQSTATGNYSVAVWGVTPDVSALPLDQEVNGQIETPYSQDQWTFSATANQQVQFDLMNSSDSSVGFDLAGPGDWSGFSNLTSSSDPIALPASGTYTLSAYGDFGKYGETYAFKLAQSPIAVLNPGNVYSGQFTGNGQYQLFQVNVPQAGQLQINLDDLTGNNVNELYAHFGAPATRADYDLRSTESASPEQMLFTSTAAAGTWYVLVYGSDIRTLGSYTLSVTTPDLTVTSITPDHAAATSDTQIAISGAGFVAGTNVELVAADGTSYSANSISIDSLTQIIATFSANTVPAGLANEVYSVRVTRPGETPVVLDNAFTMKPAGQSHFESHVVVPSAIGYFAPAIIYVEYSNTGDVAMQAPLLEFSAEQNGNQAAIMRINDIVYSYQGSDGQVTLSQSNASSTSALPQGFSNTVEFLASGTTPGILQPGETVQVSLDYAGWQKPWDTSYPPITFTLATYTADDSDSIDWSSLQSSLRPVSVSAQAWNILYPNLTAQIGSTWGSYVSSLDLTATYLGYLNQINLYERQQTLAVRNSASQRWEWVNTDRFDPGSTGPFYTAVTHCRSRVPDHRYGQKSSRPLWRGLGVERWLEPDSGDRIGRNRGYYEP